MGSEAIFEGILTNNFPKMLNTHRFKHLTNPKQDKEEKKLSNEIWSYQMKIIGGKRKTHKDKTLKSPREMDKFPSMEIR